MLGRVTWQEDGKEHYVVIEDDKSVHGTDEVVVDMTRFNIEHVNSSPSIGNWVSHILYPLAQATRGKLEITPKNKPDPDAIY